MIPPARRTLRMFSIAISERGVSRGTSTRGRLVRSMISAARTMRLSAKPLATAASVFMEQGAITMASVRNDELASRAPIW